MERYVDIILPVYNEGQSFDEFYKEVDRQVHTSWRMLVVYDFEEDNTLLVAGPLAKKDERVQLLRNEGRGVIGAIKTGFAHTTAPMVMVTAVDVLEDIKKLDHMIELSYTGGYTIVATSRYMKGGKRFAGKLLNRTLSRLASVSLYYLAGLPIHDATNGSKLYRKSFIDSIIIESTVGWAIALEITVKAHAAGKSMTEIPITHFERTKGESKFRLFKWLPTYLHWYFFAIKNRFLV